GRDQDHARRGAVRQWCEFVLLDTLPNIGRPGLSGSSGSRRGWRSFVMAMPGLRVGWFSTWNSKCGVAEHSRFLLEALAGGDLDVTILASQRDVPVRVDDARVVRCWTDFGGSVAELLEEVQRGRFDVLFVQFNFGFL